MVISNISIDTEIILNSWKVFADVLLAIGSKEMIWIICFENISIGNPFQFILINTYTKMLILQNYG